MVVLVDPQTFTTSTKKTEEEGQIGRSNEHLLLPTLLAGGDNVVILQNFVTMHFYSILITSYIHA